MSDALERDEVIGLLEEARIYPGDITVLAKMDTGARTSSLHCECITTTDRDGIKWAKLEVLDVSGKVVQLERKVHRVAKIKRHGGGYQERDVIKLNICVGSVLKETEVNLTNRSHFRYRLLVGREYLKNDFIVDPSLEFTHEISCETGSPENE